jgi:T-complex protein 1 subunit delta
MLTSCAAHPGACLYSALIPSSPHRWGGGAAKTKVSLQLRKLLMTMAALDLHCFRVYANALGVILYTLAENVGLKPIQIMTELRKAHAKGNVMAGIEVKVSCISDMYAKNVTQPLLVTTSVIELATEIVCMILKVRPDFAFLLSPQMKNGRTAIFE